MTARRLRWRGPAQQQQVLDELQRQLDAWHQGWSVDGGCLALTSAEGSGAVGAERCWLRAHARGATVWLGATSLGFARLGDRLARVRAGERSDLGERIGRRALQALLSQWLGAGAEQVEFEEAAPSPEELQARFGTLHFQLADADSFKAAILVDAALCDCLAPSTPAAMPKLEARAAALGGESITLQVRLGLGETTLADAHGLQIGDVLVSGTRLDAAFELTQPDDRVVAHGRLRRHDRRLAFALQPAATTTRKQA